MQPETEIKAVMKFNAIRLFLILSLIFSVSTVHAEDVWYQVEVIVFENLQADADGESWPVTPGYPDTDLAVDIYAEEPDIALQEPLPTATPVVDPALETVVDAQSGTAPAAVEAPVTYRQLAPEQLRIANIFSRMKRSANYRPLLHLAWYQSGEEEVSSQSVRVMLNSVQDPNSINNQQILDGTVKMRKSRFIHMDVDLAYFLPADMATLNGTQTYASLVRMQESRKMRLNELHYLDHPLFGVVVYVSPLLFEGGQ